MKTKKMTKQTITMVEAANNYFKYAHVKDTKNEIFDALCWLLLQAGCYHGYNYFTVDGRLSGGENKNFDHLEIYVK